MKTTEQTKWSSSLGPRMAKAFNTAWSAVSWEGKSYVTLSGVIGGRVLRWTYYDGQGRQVDTLPACED